MIGGVWPGPLGYETGARATGGRSCGRRRAAAFPHKPRSAARAVRAAGAVRATAGAAGAASAEKRKEATARARRGEGEGEDKESIE